MSQDTAAIQTLDAAERAVASADRDDARRALDDAEMEIELLGGAQAELLRPRLNLLRLRLAGFGKQVDSKAREGALSSVERRIENAKHRIKGGQPAPDDLAEADDYIVEVAENLTDQDKAEFRRQLAVLRKMSDRHAATEALNEAKNAMDEFRTYLKDAMLVTEGRSPGDSRFIVSNLHHVSGRIRRSAAEAGGDAEAASLVKEVDSGMKTFGEAYARSRLAELLEDITRSRTSLDHQIEDWKDETDSMTLAEMLAGAVDGHQQLGMPETWSAVLRSADWLENFEKNQDWVQGRSQKPIAEVYESVRTLQNDLRNRLEQTATRLVAEIEAHTLDDESRNRLMLFAEHYLAKILTGSPALTALQDRVRAVLRAFDEQQRGELEAARVREEELTQMANDRWGEIVRTLSPERFEVQNWRSQVGLVIQTTVSSNLCGWDYNGDDVDIAFRANGVPCYGTFEPALREAVRSVLTSVLRRYLPGLELRVIAELTGPGRMQQIVRTSKVTHNPHGADLVEELISTEPIDAVAMRVIALACGPVAVRG